jgi:hypothetical protein
LLVLAASPACRGHGDRFREIWVWVANVSSWPVRDCQPGSSGQPRRRTSPIGGRSLVDPKPPVTSDRSGAASLSEPQRDSARSYDANEKLTEA